MQYIQYLKCPLFDSIEWVYPGEYKDRKAECQWHEEFGYLFYNVHEHSKYNFLVYGELVNDECINNASECDDEAKKECQLESALYIGGYVWHLMCAYEFTEDIFSSC